MELERQRAETIDIEQQDLIKKEGNVIRLAVAVYSGARNMRLRQELFGESFRIFGGEGAGRKEFYKLIIEGLVEAVPYR